MTRARAHLQWCVEVVALEFVGCVLELLQRVGLCGVVEAVALLFHSDHHLRCLSLVTWLFSTRYLLHAVGTAPVALGHCSKRWCEAVGVVAAIGAARLA